VNFLLGVGAQRCGTTWLHRYLGQHPAVCISPCKELHVFDAKSVEVICRFLEVDVRPADFSDRANAASETGEIDPVFRRSAREHFDVVYEACAGRFGRDRLRALRKHF